MAALNEIHDALRTQGYCEIPTGTNRIDGDLLVTSNQRLVGRSKSSVLHFDKVKKHSVIMTKPKRGALYGSYIDMLGISGATIRFADLANHCSVSRLWVNDSWGDGFMIDGIGERLKLTECVAWGNAGHGFHLFTPPGVVQNGVTFDHCTATSNAGAGWRIWTGSQFSSITNTVMRGCTSQGNGTLLPGDLNFDGTIDVADMAIAQQNGDLETIARVLANFGSSSKTQAEIWVSGAVHELTFYDNWIEPIPAKVRIGVLAEAIQYGADPTYNVAKLGRPGLIFKSNNVTAVTRKHAVKTTMHRYLHIEGLTTHAPERQGKTICTSRDSTPPKIGMFCNIDSTQLCSHTEPVPWIGTYLPQEQPGADEIDGAQNP